MSDGSELAQRFADITRDRPLHEIADAIIAATVVNDDGELTPESAAALDALNLTLEQKVEAYHFVHVQLTTSACACKEQAAYWEKRAHAPKAAAERLKERLMHELGRLGLEEVRTPTVRVAIEKSPASVELVKGMPIPPEYTIAREPDPDRRKMLCALKSGAQLAFAKLVTDRRHLRWR